MNQSEENRLFSGILAALTSAVFFTACLKIPALSAFISSAGNINLIVLRERSFYFVFLSCSFTAYSAFEHAAFYSTVRCAVYDLLCSQSAHCSF